MRNLLAIILILFTVPSFAIRDLGNVTEDSTIYFKWTTNDGSGGSITRATDGTVEVYRDDDVTQSVAGITDVENFDGVTGRHHITLVLTDPFYVAGSDYEVVLTGAIVDGQTINPTIARFSIENRFDEVDAVKISGDSTSADNMELQYDTTGLTGDTFPSTQAQVGLLSLGGAGGISTPAKDEPDGFAITWGENEANDEDSTHSVDATYHDIEAQDDGGTEKIDVYYEFTIGGSGVPSSLTWTGYLNRGGGVPKDVIVQVHNWISNASDQVGTIASGTVNTVEDFTLFTSHVGTGDDLGTVRVRFLTGSSAEYTATTLLKTDQIFVTYTRGLSSVGYANGSIWVDTVNGTAGTENGVNGVADNPVLTWADALTLSASLGIVHFQIANGSTVTLAASSDNYMLTGAEWTLALNGKSCDDAAFIGAHVTGICTGSRVVFRDCDLASGGGTTTVAGIEAHNCALSGSIVLTAANTYFFDQCYSGIAGTATPDIDFGAGVANQNVNFRHYSGGIEVKNIGRAGTDKMSLEGFGQLVLNADCAASIIAIRGAFTVTDNASGVVTLSDDARIDVAQINTEADAALADYDGPTDTEFNARTIALADYFDFTSDEVTTDATSRTASKADVAGALTDIYLDYLLATDYDPASKPGVATALFNELIESDGGISRYTTNALEQAPSGGSVPTVVQIRQEMDSNSTQLIAIAADTNELQGNQGAWATATGFSTFDYTADGVIVITNSDKTGYSISGTITTLDGLNDFDPASDFVYLGNGAHGGDAATITLSDYLDFQGAAGDLWIRALPGAYADGTAGYIIGNDLDALQKLLDKILIRMQR